VRAYGKEKKGQIFLFPETRNFVAPPHYGPHSRVSDIDVPYRVRLKLYRSAYRIVLRLCDCVRIH
jgi:hypothetical protein